MVICLELYSVKRYLLKLYLFGTVLVGQCRYFSGQIGRDKPLAWELATLVLEQNPEGFKIFICLVSSKNCNPKISARTDLRAQLSEASHGRGARLGSSRSDYRLRGRVWRWN